MTDAAQFTPAEAAAITGVTVETQREWRRRGFMPKHEAGWHRFTLREVCRLRLLRELTDFGLPATRAVDQIAEAFLDALQSQVKTHGRPEYEPMYAVVGRIEGEFFRFVTFDLIEVAQLGRTRPDLEFSSLLIIPLAAVAAELVAKGARA